MRTLFEQAPAAIADGRRLLSSQPAAKDAVSEKQPELPRPGLWDAADAPAVNFAFFARNEVPRARFWVLPGELVTDVALFLEALRRDLRRGPDDVCGRSALRRARALQVLFGRKGRRGRQIISREISNAGGLPAKPR